MPSTEPASASSAPPWSPGSVHEKPDQLQAERDAQWSTAEIEGHKQYGGGSKKGRTGPVSSKRVDRESLAHALDCLVASDPEGTLLLRFGIAFAPPASERPRLREEGKDLRAGPRHRQLGSPLPDGGRSRAGPGRALR